MPRKETYSGPISAQAQQDLVSEGIENFELPKSVVMKIAKSAIPDNIKLQKETVLSLVKGSTVFINFLAATAHDVAQSKQHKSISASDVLKALETIEFSDMVNKLQNELVIYRDLSKNDKGKKGTSNGNSASAAKKGPAGSTSASAPPKGKGKEKVLMGNPLPPPFTSAPLDNPMPGPAAPMDVDDQETESASVDMKQNPNGPRDDTGDDVEEDEYPDGVEPMEYSDDASEVYSGSGEDTEALNDAELEKDARGLDGHNSVVDEN